MTDGRLAITLLGHSAFSLKTPGGSTVLFAHLGGQPAINGYSALFA